MFDSIIQKDKELLIFLNNLGSEQWDSFWLLITNQFSWTPLFLFIFYLIFKTFGLKKGGFVIVSLIVLVTFSDQFVNLIKDSVERLRPNNDPEIQHLLRHLNNPQSFSFISGHATTSTFFSVFMILLLREKYKYIYLILLFPFVFAYSRLYLGVHYPIDISLGILMGVLLANGYYFLFQKVCNKLFV
ncbi:phosphatase PAP2 family protein [Polaribacter glomeratus]|uniref:Phosphatase PAP2 family protein n=1 Tax=Polaribacter glomeratus TaxID=102 RepID=A0A2S7WX00_9FLAO|nr:phosphatase PAP2 family protein [Polaribacter glomeratus]PQJ82129.1 phosphatase PAP2 family protein [Polaribacter glomeratus]TXD66724.1 phosphatase PAP2 family protein [Polaribacter glomeratus]